MENKSTTSTFNCYSRKLMYFLGLYGVDYIDRYFNPDSGRPYWQFENNDRLRELLLKWDKFKHTELS